MAPAEHAVRTAFSDLFLGHCYETMSAKIPCHILVPFRLGFLDGFSRWRADGARVNGHAVDDCIATLVAEILVG